MPRPPQRSRGRRESRILRGPPQCGGRGDESCDRRSGLRSSPRSRGLTHGYWATALRVTRRPSCGSDGSYGPCGLDGASRPSTTPHGTRQTAGFRMARRTGTGWSRRQTAATSRRAWLRVERMVSRARGLREGAGGPPGAGGGRAARPRPTPTPTFGPGARRGTRRAPGQSEPPGGLVRPLNTWPHDRHDSRRSSSLRSTVIARDSPVRWPGGTGLASLPPLPVTRLPLRDRQHHKTIATP